MIHVDNLEEEHELRRGSSQITVVDPFHPALQKQQQQSQQQQQASSRRSSGNESYFNDKCKVVNKHRRILFPLLTGKYSIWNGRSMKYVFLINACPGAEKPGSACTWVPQVLRFQAQEYPGARWYSFQSW